jgi:hypothetical protein
MRLSTARPLQVSDFDGIGVDLSGTGNLAGLRGKLTFGGITYDGTLH